MADALDPTTTDPRELMQSLLPAARPTPTPALTANQSVRLASSATPAPPSVR